MIAAIGIAIGLGGTTEMLGVGVVGLFISLIALGPLVAAPIAKLATPVLAKISGVIGAIAGRNAARNPKRIALTAGALGVGLALLVGVATLGASSKQSVRDQVGEQFLGDFTVTPSSGDGGDGFGGLPSGLAAADRPAARRRGRGRARRDGGQPAGSRATRSPAASSSPSSIRRQAGPTLGLTFTDGGWDQLGADGLVVSKDHADSADINMGDQVTVTFLDGTTKQLAVQGIFDSKIFGDYVLNRATFEGTSNPVFDSVIVIAAKPGSDPTTTATQIKGVVDQYPTAKFQTRDEYIDSQTAQVDTFLNFIYALLGMSIFIAILGIVITLLLSVYERRRELGLMRAVGTTRGQVAGSTLWESVLTALIGAVMGVVLGLVLGWVVVRALARSGAVGVRRADLVDRHLHRVRHRLRRARRGDPRPPCGEERHPLRHRHHLMDHPRVRRRGRVATGLVAGAATAGGCAG